MALMSDTDNYLKHGRVVKILFCHGERLRKTIPEKFVACVRTYELLVRQGIFVSSCTVKHFWKEPASGQEF